MSQAQRVTFLLVTVSLIVEGLSSAALMDEGHHPVVAVLFLPALAAALIGVAFAIVLWIEGGSE